MSSSTNRVLLQTKQTEETKEIEVKEISDINATQKNLVQTTLAFIFDDIFQMNLLDALFSLHVMIDKNEPDENQIALKNIDAWVYVEQVRRILKHDFPQNRGHGDGGAFLSALGRDPINEEEYSACQNGVYKGIVYYYGSKGKLLAEPEGLLSLTSRNDQTALPITSTATKNYIIQLIKKEISKILEDIFAVQDFSLPLKFFEFFISDFNPAELREALGKELGMHAYDKPIEKSSSEKLSKGKSLLRFLAESDHPELLASFIEALFAKAYKTHPTTSLTSLDEKESTNDPVKYFASELRNNPALIPMLGCYVVEPYGNIKSNRHTQSVLNEREKESVTPLELAVDVGEECFQTMLNGFIQWYLNYEKRHELISAADILVTTAGYVFVVAIERGYLKPGNECWNLLDKIRFFESLNNHAARLLPLALKRESLITLETLLSFGGLHPISVYNQPLALQLCKEYHGNFQHPKFREKFSCLLEYPAHLDFFSYFERDMTPTIEYLLKHKGEELIIILLEHRVPLTDLVASKLTKHQTGGKPFLEVLRIESPSAFSYLLKCALQEDISAERASEQKEETQSAIRLADTDLFVAPLAPADDWSDDAVTDVIAEAIGNIPEEELQTQQQEKKESTERQTLSFESSTATTLTLIASELIDESLVKTSSANDSAEKNQNEIIKFLLDCHRYVHPLDGGLISQLHFSYEERQQNKTAFTLGLEAIANKAPTDLVSGAEIVCGDRFTVNNIKMLLNNSLLVINKPEHLKYDEVNGRFTFYFSATDLLEAISVYKNIIFSSLAHLHASVSAPRAGQR